MRSSIAFAVAFLAGLESITAYSFLPGHGSAAQAKRALPHNVGPNSAPARKRQYIPEFIARDTAGADAATNASAPSNVSLADSVVFDKSVIYTGAENGTLDCSCQCAAFDDIIDQCLDQSNSNSTSCECNDNMFGQFITCAMCDPRPYQSVVGGLKGFVENAISECKASGFKLSVDVSGLPSNSNVTSTSLSTQVVGTSTLVVAVPASTSGSTSSSTSSKNEETPTADGTASNDASAADGAEGTDSGSVTPIEMPSSGCPESRKQYAGAAALCAIALTVLSLVA